MKNPTSVTRFRARAKAIGELRIRKVRYLLGDLGALLVGLGAGFLDVKKCTLAYCSVLGGLMLLCCGACAAESELQPSGQQSDVRTVPAIAMVFAR